MTAVENVEVIYSPPDQFDLPKEVCNPNLSGGMGYLGQFVPNAATPLASQGYRLTLRVVSQFPGYITPSAPLTTNSLLVAQPMVPDAGSQPVVSPTKGLHKDGAENLGESMTDWIDRPPPGASSIGSWTFEQTYGLLNAPVISFTAQFQLENDPRTLTVTASRAEDTGPHYASNFKLDPGHGVRSYSVTLSGIGTTVSVSATNALASGDFPTTTAVDPRSVTTSDPTGSVMDLIINVRWIDDNLFVVITPKDLGDPAATGGDPDNPFSGGGFGGGGFGDLA